MDGLYIDTFGMPPIDDLSKNSTKSPCISNVYYVHPNEAAPSSTCKDTEPNSQLRRGFETLSGRRENEDENNGTNMSAFRPIMSQTRAARLSLSSPVKKDNWCHNILEQKRSAEKTLLCLACEEEGEKLAEKSRIRDEVWCCCYCDKGCCCRDRGCSCSNDRNDSNPYGTSYNSDFLTRKDCEWIFRTPCDCYCDCELECKCYDCCSGCQVNGGHYSPLGGYDDNDDDIIRIGMKLKSIQLLDLVKFWINSAADWAIQTYIRSGVTISFGIHWESVAES
ncbi:hypothetical protein GGS21DRAFT_147474 [Xylaria nigripes]|nr:hypothetical protein GGS21DRAFT_147474 [Xylaria nigripes]